MMKKLIKSILLSVSALAVGYLAISLPFNLFGTLSNSMMQVIFIAELAIYLVLGAIFLIAVQHKREKKIKMQQRHSARCEKIARVQREWYDIAA